MDPKELNIGDWVYFTLSENNDPVKVSVSDFAEEANGITHPFFVYKPISITKKILKENKFKDNWLLYDDNHHIYYDFSNNHINIFYLMGGEHQMYVDLYIGYVHELQHIFYLCGLNELADQFIIK